MSIVDQVEDILFDHHVCGAVDILAAYHRFCKKGHRRKTDECGSMNQFWRHYISTLSRGGGRQSYLDALCALVDSDTVEEWLVNFTYHIVPILPKEQRSCQRRL